MMEAFQLAEHVPQMSPPVLTFACSLLIKLILDKIGVREWIVCLAMLLMGTICYPNLVLPENSYNVRHFVFQNAMIGFFLGGSPFAGLILYNRFKPSRANTPKDTPSSLR